MYADDVNLLGANIDTLKKNTETLIYTSKEVGLEVNAEKTEYMLLSPHQNARQSHDIRILKTSFENVARFKYLVMTVTNQNLIHEEIKSRLNLGNACYHSVQKLLSFCVLFKNVKIGLYKSIILPVVLYGYGTWSLILREAHRLKVFHNRVLRRIFGWMRDEVTEVGENCVMRSFITCILCKV
jgi:hypothetical protein